MQPIRRKFSADTKALDDTRSLIVTISTPTPDRSGDVVVPKGAKLDNYLKNPVVLFGHKYNEPPIARAEELIVTDDGIKAKVTFPAEGVYEFADTIYRLFKAGIMSAWSIGFQSDADQTETLPGGGLKFNSWEMLEFSAVPVPANPEALTILRSKGLGEETIKEVTEQKAVEVAPEVIKEIEEQLGETSEDPQETIKRLETENADLKSQLEDRDQKATDDATTALKALRDALKPADKEIGLALRTLKTLLNQPKQ